MNDRRESSREAWTEISHDCLAHATHILPPAAAIRCTAITGMRRLAA